MLVVGANGDTGHKHEVTINSRTDTAQRLCGQRPCRVGAVDSCTVTCQVTPFAPPLARRLKVALAARGERTEEWCASRRSRLVLGWSKWSAAGSHVAGVDLLP